MADGELTLKLDDETARRLQAAADAAGVPVGDYAADLIAGSLGEDWTEALARLEEYDRTGEYVSLETALLHFRTEVESGLASRK
jgi:predicted transcriptional regulator